MHPENVSPDRAQLSTAKLCIIDCILFYKQLTTCQKYFLSEKQALDGSKYIIKAIC